MLRALISRLLCHIASKNRKGIWVRGGGFQHQSFLQLNKQIVDLMRQDLLPPFFLHGVHDQTRPSQLHREAGLRPRGIAQVLAAALIEAAVSGYKAD